MNSLPLQPGTAATGPRALYNRAARWLEVWIGHDLLAVAARGGIAGVFWLSGRTKVDGWLSVSESAVALFEDEYKVPVLPPELAAHLAAYAEHLFPVLLAVIARVLMRMNYLTLCGMLAGSMTDPPALAFAGAMTGSDAPSLSYATVYPLVMLLRVICAQAMVLLLMR